MTQPAPQTATCPVSHFAQSFNPFADPYLADPPAYLRQARGEEPVFYAPELDAYVVTRYDDIRAVMRDTDTFSPRNVLEPVTGLYPSSIAKLVDMEIGNGPILVNEDEPIHTERRRRLSGHFLPEWAAKLEPWIRSLVTTYLDTVVRRGRADIVKDLAWEIPALVAFKLMGVPDEDVDIVKKFAVRRTALTWGRLAEQEQNDLIDGVGEYWAYCRQHVNRLRGNLGDDLVSEAIRAQRENPGLFDEDYAYNLTFNLLFAGHETTTNALANGLRALLEHPGQWQAICDHPELIPNAVHEIIRFAPSVNDWRRLATADTRIGDVAVPAGSTVLIVLSSGNFDETHFDHADQLDVRRANAKQHLTFGVGRHTCMGAPLARTEMQIVLEELTRRLPHMHLIAGQEFTYAPVISFRGVERVLVEWDPKANPVAADRDPIEL
jgi:cytochrome P450